MHTRGTGRQRLRYGGGAPGVERLAASLVGDAFAPHRHDTYAIGVTLHGVQTFRYRGAQRYCVAGEGHVLHPDEVHDGAAATDDGFGYRIIYIDPLLVQEALGGAPLPFVADPVIGRRELDAGLRAWLADIDEPLDDWERLALTLTVVRVLTTHSPVRRRAPGPLAVEALIRVRDLIVDDPTTRHAVTRFEQISGLDRWTIARQFRVAFGTSPTRFRTMRQLDRVRTLLRTGATLGDAAIGAGFADQSHMTRAFKRAYGITPAMWTSALRERI